MELPQETKKLIEQCLMMVRQDPEHHLKPSDRFAIYYSLGESRLSLPGYINTGPFSFQEMYKVLEKEFQGSTIADYTIYWLAVLTAKFVLPITNKVRTQLPDHWQFTTANEVLEVAEGVLRKQISFEKAYLEYSGCDASKNMYIDDTTADVGGAFFASYGALEIIVDSTGVRDAHLHDPFGIGQDTFVTNALDAYSLIDDNPLRKSEDTITLEYNSRKRLEFWEWWLTETIPQAWELAVETLLDN